MWHAQTNMAPEKRSVQQLWLLALKRARSHLFQIQRHPFRVTATSSSLTLNAGRISFKTDYRTQPLTYSCGWWLSSQRTASNEPIILMKGVIIHISSLIGDYSVQGLLSFLVACSLLLFPRLQACLVFLSPLPLRLVLFLVFEFKPDLSYSVTMWDKFFVFILLDFYFQGFSHFADQGFSQQMNALSLIDHLFICIIKIGNGSFIVVLGFF